MDVLQVLPRAIDIVAQHLATVQDVEGVEHHADVLRPELLRHLHRLVDRIHQVAVEGGRLDGHRHAVVSSRGGDLPQSFETPLPRLSVTGSPYDPARDVEDDLSTPEGTEFHHLLVLLD